MHHMPGWAKRVALFPDCQGKPDTRTPHQDLQTNQPTNRYVKEDAMVSGSLQISQVSGTWATSSSRIISTHREVRYSSGLSARLRWQTRLPFLFCHLLAWDLQLIASPSWALVSYCKMGETVPVCSGLLSECSGQEPFIRALYPGRSRFHNWGRLLCLPELPFPFL